MKLYRLVFVMFFVQKILKKELYEWFWESFFFFFFCKLYQSSFTISRMPQALLPLQ